MRLSALPLYCGLLASGYGQAGQQADPARSAQAKIPDVIRVPEARSELDLSYSYHVSLLQKALQKAARGRAIPRIETVARMEQGRALRELQKGELIDLVWMGTDGQKEQLLRPVRIPLERGLLGYRLLTIKRQQTELFDRIYHLSQLGRLQACQGLNWPDASILQHAGLKVLTSPDYENLFKQINAGRCDYFPRGIHEGQPELAKRSLLYPDLVSYPHLMLHYPLTVYFFTNQQNEALAQLIEQGLEQMIDDGELLQHMRHHPLTAHVFPLAQHQVRRWFELSNPLLSSQTKPYDRRYWFVPEDFSASEPEKNLSAIQQNRDTPEQHHMQ